MNQGKLENDFQNIVEIYSKIYYTGMKGSMALSLVLKDKNEANGTIKVF